MTRIYLRPLQLADATQIQRATENDDIRRLTGTLDHFTVDAIEVFIMRAAQDDSRMDFAICLNDDTLIGEVSLLEISEVNNSGGMRIMLHDLEIANQGYGTEAMELFLRYVFEEIGLNRLELEVLAYNARAKRVYEKVGFVQEGIAREAVFYQGHYVDEIHMSMLQKDYQQRLKAR